MRRAIWKGSIAFGLVHISVNLYPATESQGISSNLLHKRIIPEFVISVSRKPLARKCRPKRSSAALKSKGIISWSISDDELKEAAPEKSGAIEIQEFVNESQIPTPYFEKPYYLEPDRAAGKAYACYAMLYCATRLPNRGRSASHNLCCATAKASAY
jgi:DNA end-binding protein Ku